MFTIINPYINKLCCSHEIKACLKKRSEATSWWPMSNCIDFLVTCVTQGAWTKTGCLRLKCFNITTVNILIRTVYRADVFVSFQSWTWCVLWLSCHTDKYVSGFEWGSRHSFQHSLKPGLSYMSGIRATSKCLLWAVRKQFTAEYFLPVATTKPPHF